MIAIPRLFITPGEPAGIGPDITVQIAQQTWPAELIAIADPDLLLARAKQIHLPLQITQITTNDLLSSSPQRHTPGLLRVLPVKLVEKVNAGEPNPVNAAYVIETLQQAAHWCLHHPQDAIVTGPVNKAVMNMARIPFMGHTEFFAHACHVPQTVMLFVVKQLKVALATTHLPLAKIPAAITQTHLQETLTILNRDLIKRFHLKTPRIAVCGLNPHAGEGGYLGCEEIEVITPVIERLRQQHYHLTGPVAADTIFTPQQLQQVDVVLAMYHDQALPLVKYAGFGHAVNMTLGLPFIRASVDHGTAFDVAGTGKSDAGSMAATVGLAIELSHG